MCWSLLILLAAGCPRSQAPAAPEPAPLLAAWAGPHRPAAARYSIAVEARIGEIWSMRALYDLATEPRGEDVFTVITERSRGTWQEGTFEVAFDSDSPRADDPWPVTLLDALAGIPALVRFGPDGRPLSLVDPEDWRMQGMRAFTALDLPPEALTAGRALLDPDGFVRDLQRTFPGAPPTGTWIRQERLADVPFQRIETCGSPTREIEGTRWRCEGKLEPLDRASGDLSGQCTSEILVDEAGLVVARFEASGTVALQRDPSAEPIDRDFSIARGLVRR